MKQMLKVWMFGCFLLIAGGARAEIVGAKAAADSIGKTVTLEYQVLEVGQSGKNAGGPYVELYSSPHWDDPGCVFIRVPGTVVATAQSFGITDLQVLFKGSIVRATGTPQYLQFKGKDNKPVVCLTIADLRDLTVMPPEMIEKQVQGFTVRINKQQALISQREVMEVEAAVASQLKGVVAMVGPTVLAEMRKIPITIERGANRAAAAYDWRTDEESLVRTTPWSGVMINNWYEYIRTTRESQPLALLHELAHAYHHQVLGGENRAVLNAYDNAMKQGLYEKVARLHAKPQKAYATTNEKEYFCEITEAWFGANDFYPFNHDELIKHDPVGAKLMMDVWGMPRSFAKPNGMGSSQGE